MTWVPSWKPLRGVGFGKAECQAFYKVLQIKCVKRLISDFFSKIY